MSVALPKQLVISTRQLCVVSSRDLCMIDLLLVIDSLMLCVQHIIDSRLTGSFARLMHVACVGQDIAYGRRFPEAVHH